MSKEIKKGWKEIPIGGLLLDAGNSREYETGTWRTFKPIHNAEKCINCYFCWEFCPDNSILIKDDKVVGMNYFQCKGCGVCAAVCPTKAIEMVKEEK
ncbi:4Fe-4S binding protein [bacterium]|nr:4Fe-4S binding protein [bacterium]